MKKTITSTLLLLVTLLFISCSSNDDNFDSATFQKVQGKWKLTSYFTDAPFDSDGNPLDLNISNGYELELKPNKTFTSNEIAGFTGGTYTILKTPGTNLRLVYKNETQKLIRYKYILYIDENQLDVSYSEITPINDEAIFYGFLTLTRVP